ncbi:MAG: hypothetical protein R3E21_08095 [Caenibius sp.]
MSALFFQLLMPGYRRIGMTKGAAILIDRHAFIPVWGGGHAA